MLRLSSYGLVVFLILEISDDAYSQANLIPNWSFEIVEPNMNGDTICPGGSGQIGIAAFWSSAEGGVDYYNACSNEMSPNFGVPSNRVGWQQAYEGEAYAAFGFYSSFYPDLREYLWVELPDPLIRGGGYYFELHASLGDSLNYAISGIGALFTVDDTRYWDDEDFFEAVPQVENPQSNLLDDKENWVKTSGQFVAEGGERFLTIGSFRRDIDETIVQVSNHPEATFNWNESGYYVDGIGLYIDNSIGISENEAIITTLYPNPSNGEGITLEYAMQQNATAQWEITDMAGRTVHVQALQGNEGRATLVVRLPQGIYISTIIADGVRLGGNKLVVY